MNLLVWYYDQVRRDPRIAQAVRRYYLLLLDEHRTSYTTVAAGSFRKRANPKSVEAQRPRASAIEAAKAAATEFATALPSAFRSAFAAAAGQQAKFEVIRKHYQIKQVRSAEDVENALYVLGADKEVSLVCRFHEEGGDQLDRYDRERGAFMSVGKWRTEQAADQATSEKIHSARRMLALVLGALEATRAAQQRS